MHSKLIRLAPKMFIAGMIGLAAGTASSKAGASVETSVWNELTKKHVRSNGGVDYVGLKADKAKLESYIAGFAKFNPTLHDDNAKKAHYINFYNALMIFNILKYADEKKISVTSKEFTELKINDIKVKGGNIWNGSYKANLGGQMVHLDNIEHDLIRGGASSDLAKFKVTKLDPRIHAAVNCAAISCPPVRELAYTKENIEGLLDENFKTYVSSPSQFKMVSADKMKANSIVFWYYADFDDYAQDVLKLKGAGDYLAKYIDPASPGAKEKAEHLKENFNDRNRVTLKLSSAFDFSYDWIINDIRNIK